MRDGTTSFIRFRRGSKSEVLEPDSFRFPDDSGVGFPLLGFGSLNEGQGLICVLHPEHAGQGMGIIHISEKAAIHQTGLLVKPGVGSEYPKPLIDVSDFLLST